MYGAALETWAQEPLTSSAVDVWVKRTHRLVINDWYMVDDYHARSAGKAPTCTRRAVRAAAAATASGRTASCTRRPISATRASLANGPIRVMFELTYDGWDRGGSECQPKSSA